MENPVQVIVAAFSDPESAGLVMADLKEGRKEGLIGIKDAAVVVKDADGKVKVTDAKKRTAKGFVTGGVVGGLIGLIAAPAVAAAAAGGGVLGALIGKLRSSSLKNEMKSMGASMPNNSSAIVATIEHTWVSQLQSALEDAGAQLFHDSLKADIAEQLNAGGNVLYTAGGGTMGSGAMRMANSASGAQMGGVLVGDNGVIADNIEITNEPVEETATAG